MDSGYLAPGETLDDDYDVLRHLEPEEVIGIMDQLICFEVGPILYLVDPGGPHLMLIAGLVDGVAQGSSTLSVTLYFQLY